MQSGAPLGGLLKVGGHCKLEAESGLPLEISDDKTLRFTL